MRRRVHGRDVRTPEEKLRRILVRLQGMHRGGDRDNEGRKEAGSGFQGRAAGGRGQLVRFPRIPEREGDRGSEALRHRRPPRHAGGDCRILPKREPPALPGPRPEEHSPSRQDPRQEGDHGRFQGRLLERLEGRMRRSLRRIRLEMVEAVPKADAVPRREAGRHVQVLRIPQAYAEGDLHLQRGGVPQFHSEEEDEGEDTVQFRGLGVDRPGEDLRGLQPRREAGEVHARAERGGKGGDGIRRVTEGRLCGLRITQTSCNSPSFLFHYQC